MIETSDELEKVILELIKTRKASSCQLEAKIRKTWFLIPQGTQIARQIELQLQGSLAFEKMKIFVDNA